MLRCRICTLQGGYTTHLWYIFTLLQQTIFVISLYYSEWI